jgi:hypothetical protein
VRQNFWEKREERLVKRLHYGQLNIKIRPRRMKNRNGGKRRNKPPMTFSMIRKTMTVRSSGNRESRKKRRKKNPRRRKKGKLGGLDVVKVKMGKKPPRWRKG